MNFNADDRAATAAAHDNAAACRCILERVANEIADGTFQEDRIAHHDRACPAKTKSQVLSSCNVRLVPAHWPEATRAAPGCRAMLGLRSCRRNASTNWSSCSVNRAIASSP